MPDAMPSQQAREIIVVLPTVIRHLFTMEGDPAGELPLAQLQVCSLLFDAPRAMTLLSRELKISLSAMTQLADRMERAGLVRRVIEGADRRVRRLQLTPRGEEILRYREEARLQQVVEVIEQLSPRQRRQVLFALRKLLAACELKKNNHRPAALAGNG
ncbi:MAG: MarR family transcriptional regulator [Pirellulales bacterium]|nr:MarR family transcriptional regulator [Pirellulales bacterium]